MSVARNPPPTIECDEATGLLQSVRLFERELIDPASLLHSETTINCVPSGRRLHSLSASGRESQPLPHERARFKAERFISFWAGAGFVFNRSIGSRPSPGYGMFGLEYWLRRDHFDSSPKLPVIDQGPSSQIASGFGEEACDDDSRNGFVAGLLRKARRPCCLPRIARGRDNCRQPERSRCDVRFRVTRGLQAGRFGGRSRDQCHILQIGRPVSENSAAI